jgi:hypothetical protein
MLSKVATTTTRERDRGARPDSHAPDLLVGLTEGCSAALLVSSFFALAGIVEALALIRVDMSQVEEAAAALPWPDDPAPAAR